MDDIAPLAANLPWVDIILACVEYVLSTLDQNLLIYCQPLNSADINVSQLSYRSLPQSTGKSAWPGESLC